ncbi:hypothetical protein [Pseudomonas sp.]|uniref:hypothetical protein n=1 Tax=Pseudomonas sp. TaxID=306 RepID=UPI00289C59AC|nr:hypothetical protein [Pseudomonas sp.]
MSSKLNRALFLACLLSVPLLASAQVASQDYSHTVRTMLNIDAELALMNEQKRLQEAQGHSTSAAPFVTPGFSQATSASPEVAKVEEKPAEPVVEKKMVSLQLLGIFGLGDKLFADVDIDNSRVRFQRGKASPISATSDVGYRLVSINVPCVLLTKGTDKVQLCLEARK